MLAKVHIMVPFDLSVVLDEKYNLYAYEQDGYEILFEPPSLKSEKPVSQYASHVRIDGKDCVQFDVVTITFKKQFFAREQESSLDPPQSLINGALRSLLERLRFVLKTPQIKIVDLEECNWQLRYYNDDGSELEEAEGFVRGRGAVRFGWSCIGVTPVLWDTIFSLPVSFEPPAWHTLLIDSRGALPHVGTAIVLAFTGLEIFIAELLDRLVSRAPVPELLWTWINDRNGSSIKEPSVEEQFDVLLKVLTRRSIKDESDLWEAFSNLRTARNSFVHTGVARIGKSPLSPVVSVAKAIELIERADEITMKIREWIPEDCRWQIFQHDAKVEVSHKIAAPSIPSNDSNKSPVADTDAPA